jgi:glycosyltransferase involved in cell wall biosynthesis
MKELEMEEKRKLCFNWGVSDHYGWGIYGFNLLMYGQMSDYFQIIPLEKPSFQYPIDPLAAKFIAERLPKSNIRIDLKSHDIILSGLGNSNNLNLNNKLRNIGVIFSEVNPLPIEEVNKLKAFEFVVCGSSWNSMVLEKYGIKTQKIIQGIDLDLFRSAPKKYFKDKYVIFSGGKLEYRKGQDLTLKAFSIFSKRHSDVVLVTAWRSSWERQMAKTINKSNVCEQIVPSDDMGRSINEWIMRNGVNSDKVICLDVTPNRLMPEVFREVDLAVFPNRCEGGTNLVAMEALAYGLPSIISKNTGHLDLIKNDNCIPLVVQKQIHGHDTTDWGESSVDEIVDLMEQSYQGKIKINPVVARESVINYSWENTINAMLTLLKSG